MSDWTKAVEWGDNVQEVVCEGNCKMMKMENETGEGVMTLYEVFPGALITFNDFHMAHCESKFHARENEIFCIDHCREGSMEYVLDKDYCYYFEAGDFVVDNRQNHAGNVNYPQKHFHGISIGFYLPIAEEQLKKELKDFSISLYDLHEKFTRKAPYVIRASEEVAHIFSDMYRVPAKIKKDYFRIKIFELLLYLDALELEEEKAEKPYFYKSQVEKIKAAQELLTSDLTKHYTIEELAERFDVSQTSLKSCFKAIYGTPINSYMQSYRMNIAATMLMQERKRSVAEIAGLVGYDSPSKFSAVFKKIMGITPLDYRKKGKEMFLDLS